MVRPLHVVRVHEDSHDKNPWVYRFGCFLWQGEITFSKYKSAWVESPNGCHVYYVIRTYVSSGRPIQSPGPKNSQPAPSALTSFGLPHASHANFKSREFFASLLLGFDTCFLFNSEPNEWFVSCRNARLPCRTQNTEAPTADEIPSSGTK